MLPFFMGVFFLSPSRRWLDWLTESKGFTQYFACEAQHLALPLAGANDPEAYREKCE